MLKEIVTLKVQGMSCSHCENAVKKAVGALNGVSEVDVDLEAGTVTVEYDLERLELDLIRDTIDDQGYEVK